MNYFEVKQAAARIKQEFPVLDYFQSLVRSGFLKYEGIHGKEYFFGFNEQRTGSIAVDEAFTPLDIIPADRSKQIPFGSMSN